MGSQLTSYTLIVIISRARTGGSSYSAGRGFGCDQPMATWHELILGFDLGY
jgi:hypothetical protein